MDEDWFDLNALTTLTDLFDSFSTHEFKCEGASELCTYFPVGVIPDINYEMYDVAVMVVPSAELNALTATSIDFHIAYMNPEFTEYQMVFRTIFTIISLVVMCMYISKICCRIPEPLQRKLTFEQRGAMALACLLFFFNDPMYPVHIYRPSFFTYAVTELY